jgi:hypothetical protein
VTIQSKIFCIPGLISQIRKIKMYRNIILLDVLYGCESWSFSLREEQGL